MAGEASIAPHITITPSILGAPGELIKLYKGKTENNKHTASLARDPAHLKSQVT